MIYIFTALYCEAQIFIKKFGLGKEAESTQFQVFYSEAADIRLTITGTGEIAAAAAVGSICGAYKPKRKDILLNIGTCACMAESDGIFLCHKLTEQTTGKTFYPDVLYRHPFREEAIVTGMLPWNGENDAGITPISGGKLYDMEAAAIYQAGSYFFGPHQMVFLKIVSDAGNAKGVSKKQIEQLMESDRDMIFDYIEQLRRLTGRSEGQEDSLREEEAMTEKLCADLHCSKVMGDSLRQHIRYFALAGVDYKAVIREMYQENRIPCKDKREGKRCFEELKRRLL